MTLINKRNVIKNVIANYIGKFWGVASIYLFVPFYVSILGIGNYSIIAFNAMILAFLFMADAGLGAAFSREVAKSGGARELSVLFISIERIILFLSIVISAVFLISAPYIEKYWLSSSALVSSNIIVQSLTIMAFSLIPQVITTYYLGGLMGFQKQVLVNSLNVIFGITRSGLVIIAIYALPDVRLFLFWQLVSNILFAVISRKFLTKYLNFEDLPKNYFFSINYFSFPKFNEITGYASGMLGMAFIAAANNQIDKIIVSFILPLETFARYSIISALAQIPIIAVAPIATALLPRMTYLNSKNGSQREGDFIYRNFSFYVSAITCTVGIAILLFIPDIISIWMGSGFMEASILDAGRLLSLGSIFAALQIPAYQLALANGHVKTNLNLGLIVLIVSIPLQLTLTKKYGIVGSSLPWLIINSFAFLYLGYFLNIKFSELRPTRWLITVVIPPSVIAILVLLIAKIFSSYYGLNPLVSCMIAAIASLISVGSSHLWARKKGLGMSSA